MKLPVIIDDRFIRDANDVIVAIVGVTAADEADFIANAINSHADLMVALEKIADPLLIPVKGAGLLRALIIIDEMSAIARAALAKAKGGQNASS